MVDRTVRDRLLNRASGLADVRAIPEPAFRGVLSDVFEGSVQSTIITRQRKFSKPRGIYYDNPRCEPRELSVGRRVTATVVGCADRADFDEIVLSQRVHE